ncbi:MAG: HlyC/CorC family transporter [Clostridia bacterium]|nr:HlyC/CorC family transporter [Clostridia bacterium]
MDSDSIPICIVAIVVLIALSAFFSATETAYSSLNRARLKILQDSGKNSAKLAYKLTENYDRLLFTILIGNNIVNILLATLSTLLFATLIKTESIATTVSTAASTVAVLIFGEITPKTLAKEFPEKTACGVAYIINFFIIILYPLNLIFSGWKILLKKVFRFKAEDVITEEELLTYVEEANEDGTLDKNETELISSAIEFNDSEVGDILVPRVQIVAIDVDASMEEIKKIFFDNGFSRLPVYKGSIDSIIGMIHEKDFYSALEHGATNIRGIITSMALATEHMKIPVLLRSMQKQKVHMAVVVDEYGGTLGVVTLEDILEELVGEIWDEHDEVVEYFTKLSDDSYLVDGNADISDFFELFSQEEDEETDANTVSGWVIEKCRDIPPINYKFKYNDLNIEVTKRTLKKVLEIKVTVEKEKEEEV